MFGKPRRNFEANNRPTTVKLEVIIPDRLIDGPEMFAMFQVSAHVFISIKQAVVINFSGDLSGNSSCKLNPIRVPCATHNVAQIFRIESLCIMTGYVNQLLFR